VSRLVAILALLLLAVFVPVLAGATEQTATFDYTGWHCARCGPKIEQALRKTKAVKSAIATLDRVTVVYDDRFTDPDKLAAMIEAAGPYKVAAKRVVTPTPTPTPTATPPPSPS
jgi:copper chaperone CopZ